MAPNTVSQSFILPASLIKAFQASRKSSPLLEIPKKLLTWIDPISRAAAQVKPDTIGKEKNSITKPVTKSKTEVYLIDANLVKVKVNVMIRLIIS